MSLLARVQRLADTDSGSHRLSRARSQVFSLCTEADAEGEDSRVVKRVIIDDSVVCEFIDFASRTTVTKRDAPVHGFLVHDSPASSEDRAAGFPTRCALVSGSTPCKVVGATAAIIGANRHQFESTAQRATYCNPVDSRVNVTSNHKLYGEFHGLL